MPNTNDGKDFEEAVYRFVKALGLPAEVRFDYKVPDRDTGTNRQCDVWIEGRFQGHFPIKYLISCKDWNRKLDIDDICTFKAQIDSVGASSGAVYSRTGFTAPAIDKAKAMGIACCSLYRNQPADIPEVMLFHAYHTRTTVRLHIKGFRNLDPHLRTWGDLFALLTTDTESAQQITILDLLAKIYRAGEQEAVREKEEQRKLFPPDFVRTIEFQEIEAAVSIVAEWRKYRGVMSAHLIDGSYSFTDGHFSGQQSSPSIDTWSNHPGAGWEELQGEVNLDSNAGTLLIMLLGPAIQRCLSENLGMKFLPDEI